MSTRWSILKASMRERLSYDLGAFAAPASWTLFAGARALIASPLPSHRSTGFELLMRLHRAAWWPSVDRRTAVVLRDALEAERAGRPTGLSALYDRTIRESADAFLARPNSTPCRLLGSHILVVKHSRPAERGVIIVDYLYAVSALAGLFDLGAIADRYTIVLEPSWAGICMPEILLYSRLEHPVFVETVEPRDHALLAALGTNLIAVPLASNCWMDHRWCPPQPVPRDIDVAIVAAWADIKRHWRVFRALAALRRRGHRLKVTLIGYPGGRTKAHIEALASHFGIADQIEAHERISPEEVSALLWRSKIHVLWSRREASGRALIEAMLADTPVIVREGLTFGFEYPYINAQTGRFVAERDLGEAMLEMIESRDRYSPRAWVVEHMTPQHATRVLEARLRQAALASGEPWTEGLAVRTETLDTQHYWNPDDRARFEDDYRFLKSCILRPS